MLFSSAAFLLLFLPATVVVYWLVPARARIGVIVVASYAFYLSWEPRYGLLLAASTVFNYVIARRLPSAARPRALLAVGIAANLAVLAFFKYIGLFSASAAALVELIGLAESGSYDGLQVLLPLAISFFTFEMISVLVDVHRGDVRVEGFWHFAAYKAYFPKLLSGPITRLRELGPQLSKPARLTFEAFQSGLALIALGLAKKLALANNLALLANPVFAEPGEATAGAALVAILAFGLQILLDFSAYTDIARGTSRLLGLELPRNFAFPYAATSPRDFWQRWHMSLSRWLRDYLYIPLGGNRRGRLAQHRNIMITMVLGGLWHGAAWHFAVWGAIHGVLISASHVVGGRVRRPGLLLRVAGWLATMCAVFGAWVFFRAESVARAVAVLGALTRPALELDTETALWTGVTLGTALAALLIALALYGVAGRFEAALRRAVARPRGAVRAGTLAAASLAAWTAAGLLAPSSNEPFIYFRF